MKSNFTKIFFLITLLFLSLQPQAQARARGELDLSDLQSFQEFEALVQEQQENELSNGQAYMISGALLVVGGMVGYHNSKTSVEKLAFSISQSLGVAGMGYGAYLHSVGSDQRSFYRTLDASRTLTLQNKDELVRSYAEVWRVNRKNEKWIKIATHSVVAAINIYNGLREDGELRQGLVALGGIHFLAAISLSFR